MLIRSLLALLALSSLSGAAVREVDMKGELMQEVGSFFNIVPGTPFTLSVQLDLEPGAFDWNSSPNVGLYWFPSAPLSLDFGDYHFESEGVYLTIWSGLGANWGFIFWSGAAFTANGFDVAPNGIYMQYLTADPSVAPDDTLASLRAYDASTAMVASDRFYMISDGFTSQPPHGTRLLSVPGEPRGFTINDVPEPAEAMLLASGAVIALLSARRRKV